MEFRAVTPFEPSEGGVLFVVPTYNERDNLRELTARFFAAAPAAHLLIVDDASPDGTADLCVELQQKYAGLHLLRRSGPRGLGRAYLAGFRYGLERGYRLIGTMDADLSHAPEHLATMLPLARTADIVVGSRYIRDGGVINWRIRRILLSWLANRFAAGLLGVPASDMTSGYRLYRREALETLDLDAITSNGYSFLVEILSRLHGRGCSVVESPIVFYDRRLGDSKLHPREIYIGAVRLLVLALLTRTRAPRDGSPKTAPDPVAAGTWGTGRPGRGLAAASVLVAWLIPVLSFTRIFPLVTNIPTWDQWHLIDLWSAHYEGRPVLALVLQPYNGHLNVVPRFVFYVMGVLSGWNVRLDIVASYLAACGTLALLLGLLARLGARGLWLAAPVSAQVFSLVQYENFMSGYPFGQNLSQLLATAVIVLLTRSKVGVVAFAGATAAAAGATFSWGAGLAAWYVGLVALVLGADRRRRIVTWLLLTAAATIVVRLGATAAFDAMAWSRVVPFFLAVVGKPWALVAFPALHTAVLLGAVAGLAFAALCAWSARELRLPSVRPWVLLGLSALASAGLVSLGRSGSGMVHALSSHYATATYPIMVACLVLLAIRLHASRRVGVVLLAATLAMLPPALVSYEWMTVLPRWARTVERNTVQIARGTAPDAVIRASHHPDTQLVRRGVEVMRTHRLSWFRDVIEAGPPSGVVDLVAGQAARRDTLEVKVDEPWRIEGWAVRSRRHGGPVKAVQAFVDGRSVATADLDRPRPDVAGQAGSAAFLESGWVISVPAFAVADGPHRLSVSASDYHDGRFTLLETEIVARSARPAGEHRQLGAR